MSYTSQWNPRVLLAVLGAGVVIIYVGSTALSRTEEKSDSKTKSMADSNSKLPQEPGKVMSVRERSPPKSDAKVKASDCSCTADVPAGILTGAKVDIKENNINVEADGQKIKVFYREVKGDKTPVLLLHGMAFKSQDWVDVGTIQMLSRANHRVVAVDLPGHGQSQEVKVKDKRGFLKDLIAKLNLGKPVIVSPSMSGTYALPYILKPRGKCMDKVSGYVPIAPAGTKEFDEEDFKSCQIPVLITYGSKDGKLGKEGAKILKDFPNHKEFIQEGAGHPSWKDKSEEFNTGLYNFLKLIG